jgi:hypothetical protein
MQPFSPQVIFHANFIRTTNRAPSWVVGAGERIGFHGEALQNSIFQLRKLENFILYPPLRFFSDSVGIVTRSRHI